MPSFIKAIQIMKPSEDLNVPVISVTVLKNGVRDQRYDITIFYSNKENNVAIYQKERKRKGRKLSPCLSFYFKNMHI